MSLLIESRFAKATFAALTVCAGLAAASAAQAECKLKGLQVSSDGVVISYDPFDRNPDNTSIPLRVTSTGCDNARLEITVVPEIDSLSPAGELQASNGDQSLALDVTYGGAQASVASDAAEAFTTASPSVRLAGRSGQLVGEGLRIELPYGAAVAPGRYRSRANLVARAIGDDGEAGESVSAPFFIEIDVQASFRLAAGVERPRLWLGELTEGEASQPLTFLAFSNTRYALKVRSEHGGRMTLNGSDGHNAPGVPYDLRISDRELNWVDGEGELRFSEPRFLLRTHEVVAVTGEVDNRRPAGDYKDWVTIEISPLIS